MRILIGDKAFYKSVLTLAVPIIIQNGISNFVNMLDNIMVGQLGTLEMSSVSIVNQILLVFNFGLFGVMSGAGIMGAQFYGNHDDQGLRNTFRFKLIACLLLFVAGVVIFEFFGAELTSLYLEGESEASVSAETLGYASQYLSIMVIGLLPFVVSQAYSSTLRETSETFHPMTAALIAVMVNLFFNYLLIFGKCGFPMLGIRGAAIATVLSRLVECGYIVGWTHMHSLKNRFIRGVYRNFKVPAELARQIIVQGAPLFANELLFSSGLAIVLECYSYRGLTVVAAMNISNTISNVFQVVYMALGNAVAIMVGQLLGAGRPDDARLTAYRLITFSTTSGLVLGMVMTAISPWFPQIYNTSPEVKMLAGSFIVTAGIWTPIHAFVNASYFTIRSGGRTIVTFFFDSMFMWAVSIPLAYMLARYSTLDIRIIYLAVCLADLAKCLIGFVLIRKGVWIRKIVPDAVG